MRRTLVILTFTGFFLTISGCAGHHELKAPCAAQTSAAWFSSSAFADEGGCGPLVRQSGVSQF